MLLHACTRRLRATRKIDMINRDSSSEIDEIEGACRKLALGTGLRQNRHLPDVKPQ